MIKQEWAYLRKNKILLLVFLAIIAIPTIYTTLFLGSMWDPYGKVDHLPVAIVNEDKPVTYNDETLEVGKEMVDSLKDNDSLDFHFVSSKEAKDGLKNGTYYMVITIPEDFSPETYFQDSFGIIQGEGKTYDILLKVEAEQAKYFRVLPLHDSQIETVTGPVYSIFKYHLKITYDLKQEILSFGKTVEVLAPEELRYDISNILRQACSLYDKK